MSLQVSALGFGQLREILDTVLTDGHTKASAIEHLKQAEEYAVRNLENRSQRNAH